MRSDRGEGAGGQGPPTTAKRSPGPERRRACGGRGEGRAASTAGRCVGSMGVRRGQASGVRDSVRS